VPLPVILRRTRFNRSSLAAVLAVLEAELPPDLIAPRLATTPAVVDPEALLLYSFMTAQTPSVRDELSELLARHGDRLLAVAGGSHPTGDPEGTRAMGFRWVMTGEAGRGLAGLVRAVADGRPPPPGVLSAGDRVALDHYPPWPHSGELFAQVEITRGCPIGCTFCQTPHLHGTRPRHRSLEALERILRHAVETGHSFTRFVAPNAFAYGSRDGRSNDRRAVEGLLRLVRRLGMREAFLGNFPSEVRPESVTAEMLSLVRDYCSNRTIVVGIQSGSPEVLRRLRRGHTVDDARRAVALIAAAGLEPWVDFIFGLPGESAADRAATRALIRELVDERGARLDTHVFTPLPGTPLAAERASPLDDETRALVEELVGRGRASGLRCFARIDHGVGAR
jgi:B12-binding domain/radical SAM domain protein